MEPGLDIDKLLSVKAKNFTKKNKGSQKLIADSNGNSSFQSKSKKRRKSLFYNNKNVKNEKSESLKEYDSKKDVSQLKISSHFIE